jgi:hypothetical protein
MVGTAPDEAEIARIVQLGDPVLRNLQITLAYCRLSLALDRRLGSGNVNWCTFATWASKRAGRTIRGEELRARLHRRLAADERFEAALSRLNARLLQLNTGALLSRSLIVTRLLDLVGYLSATIAEGNLKVFAELAPAFSRLLAAFEGDSQLERDKLAGLLAHFRPGPTSADGQELLRAAFSHYAEAIFEPDPKAKAELILLANDQVGLHEQTRLQPNIANALNGPVLYLGERLQQDIRSRLPLWWLLRWKLGLLRLQPVSLLEPFLPVVAQIWREEATLFLMELPLPGELLGLAWDLPPLAGQPMFPASLQDLHHPELLALLQQVDRTPNTTSGSGALDWANLEDRMHYIADLFRSRQCHQRLLEPPFDPDQCQAIAAGRVPSGAL